MPDVGVFAGGEVGPASCPIASLALTPCGMPADNVTPFRRPPPKRPAAPQHEGWGFKTHRGKVVLAHVLTLAAFALNWSLRGTLWSYAGLAVGIAAFLIAYSNRGAAMPWANTHHEHAVRTLMIGYAVWTLGSLLSFITPALALVTWGMQLAVALWAGLRAAIALVLGAMRKPVRNPRGWLV